MLINSVCGGREKHHTNQTMCWLTVSTHTFRQRKKAIFEFYFHRNRALILTYQSHEPHMSQDSCKGLARIPQQASRLKPTDHSGVLGRKPLSQLTACPPLKHSRRSDRALAASFQFLATALCSVSFQSSVQSASRWKVQPLHTIEKSKTQINTDNGHLGGNADHLIG